MKARVRDDVAHPPPFAGEVGEILPHRLEGDFPVLLRLPDGTVLNYRDEELERLDATDLPKGESHA